MADSGYGLQLLALEREELRSIWHELMNGLPAANGPVFCAFGQEGARLFVIRQLLAMLPSAHHCLLHNQDAVFHGACRRLVDEFMFLSGFRLSMEYRTPDTDIVSAALRIVSGRGLDNQLKIGNHPLHLYCLDYRLPEPAYYLYPSHTVVCGATQFDKRRQLHCLLHELGHVVYAAKQTGGFNADKTARKNAAEQFANRFAVTMLTSV